MANALGQDLTGKVVYVKRKFFRPELRDKDRRFLCQNGFGCHAFTAGQRIAGRWFMDGEEDVISGYDVEALTDDQSARPPEKQNPISKRVIEI